MKKHNFRWTIQVLFHGNLTREFGPYKTANDAIGHYQTISCCYNMDNGFFVRIVGI